jgi:hypothetical protein
LTSAQELDPRFVKTPPDYLIYGSFLRNEAAFEKLARHEEQEGRSGNAYRAHFISLYGLSASEQNTIAAIALETVRQLPQDRPRSRLSDNRLSMRN